MDIYKVSKELKDTHKNLKEIISFYNKIVIIYTLKQSSLLYFFHKFHNFHRFHRVFHNSIVNYKISIVYHK